MRGLQTHLPLSGLTLMASTIKNVARAAGVSAATVSRVLNGADNVSGETRTKVLTAISRLQYCPNPHAVELRRANAGAAPNGRAQVRALVGKRAKPPSYSLGNFQTTHGQKGQLRLFAGEFKRVRRVVAKLNRDLEKLKRIIPEIIGE
jgi:hypothetical protein